MTFQRLRSGCFLSPERGRFDSIRHTGWYNFNVPTPFYHLSLAEELLRQPTLPGRVRNFLEGQRGAFLFGSTAPDVQEISGQRREATHFFDLPIPRGAPLPWEAILQSHPALAVPHALPGAQAAFLAGYLCHLQADWRWVVDIFAPIFGPTCTWETFHRRLYLHNILRAYLDLRVLPGLPWVTGASLSSASPCDWLSFVKDRHLCEWRDFLATQLQPGAAAQTVEVFAARQGIASEEFYALLASEERMQSEVFIHLSYQQVELYRQRLIEENLQLLCAYLSFLCQDFAGISLRPISKIHTQPSTP